MRHCLFWGLRKNKNDLKTSCIRHLTARHFNSLAFDVSALAASHFELRQKQKIEVAGSIQSVDKQIKGLQKKLKEARSRLEKVSRYRAKVKAWKDMESQRNKPVQPTVI